jgi:hypothetical protein
VASIAISTTATAAVAASRGPLETPIQISTGKMANTSAA